LLFDLLKKVDISFSIRLYTYEREELLHNVSNVLGILVLGEIDQNGYQDHIQIQEESSVWEELLLGLVSEDNDALVSSEQGHAENTCKNVDHFHSEVGPLDSASIESKK
jgi:hypothetical protein